MRSNFIQHQRTDGRKMGICVSVAAEEYQSSSRVRPNTHVLGEVVGLTSMQDADHDTRLHGKRDTS